jgi:hypothetical protein
MLAKVNCPRRQPFHSALVTLFFVAIFTALFSPILFSDRLLANGDALLYYLPAFVSPRALWTTALYGGYPIAADPQAETWYPVGFLFLHRRELWNFFVLSAYVAEHSQRFVLPNFQTQDTRVVTRSASAVLLASPPNR